MKLIKITIATLLLLSITTNIKAQATASATAEGTIVNPISITKINDVDFGNLAVSASIGTVVLDPAGARSITGGVTLPATTGSVSSGNFLVNGVATYTYSITLPTVAHTITHTNNTDVMTVDNFTSNPSVTGVLGNIGQFITLGATLNVAGSQLPGVYTSLTGFDVTVNYN